MRRSTAFSIFVLIVFLVAGWMGIVHRQELIDRWRILNYRPAASIKKLADDTSMSDQGRRLYYVTHPILDDKTSFVNHCPVGESTIVLGCYDGRQIFILKVDEPKLEGVEEVTAAHEMLHAAYKRLSSTDKIRINALVKAAYQKQHDERLTKTYETYQKTEPGEEDNELHSILATEVSDVGPDLEAYYKKYFDDRSKVVSLAKQYKSVFNDLELQVADYDKQLQDLKTVIETSQSNLDKSSQSITKERNRLNRLLNSGQTSEYNAGVGAFNQSITDYNAQVAQLQANIAQYNQLVEDRNKVATAQRDLTHSLEATYKPLSQ